MNNTNNSIVSINTNDSIVSIDTVCSKLTPKQKNRIRKDKKK